jgi:PAS domain S-box-containing protein
MKRSQVLGFAAVALGIGAVVAIVAACWWVPRPLTVAELLGFAAAAGLTTVTMAWLWIASLRAHVQIRTRELSQTEATFSLLADQIRDVLWIVHPPHEVVYVSPRFADLWGRSGEGIQRSDMLEAVYPEDLPSLAGEHARAEKERLPYTIEYRIAQPDGGFRWICERGFPSTDNRGRPVIAGVCTDVTERHLAEQEREAFAERVRKVEKIEAVGRLAGSVAHDLNNMLAPIVGYAGLLLETMDAGYERDQVTQLHRAARRARDLVAKLQALGRRQTLKAERVDLRGVVTSIEPLVRRVLREDISIEWRSSDTPCPVVADAGQIERVFMNLVVNAQDAMPTGGELTVEVRPETVGRSTAARVPGLSVGSYAVMSVSDTGAGMSDSIQERLFEPFFSTKGDSGSGLGLASAYGTVKQHGGSIAVDSVENVGTTFKVYLPQAPALSTGHRTTPPPGETTSGTERVIVVEDDPQVRALACAVLERQGYDVLHAGNGREALTVLGSTDGVNLILTDVIMPEMNGRELQETVARDYPAIRVLFMSGYAGDTVAAHGVIDDGTSFIQKPFTPAALAQAVRAVLDAP